MQIAVGSEGLWQNFAQALGLDAHDPRFATNDLRVLNRLRPADMINSALAARRMRDVLASLASAGIPAGRVRKLDGVYGWPQVLSQGLLVEVDHRMLGPITLPGSALRFDWAGRADHAAPPVLGQDDARVRAWLDDRDGGRAR